MSRLKPLAPLRPGAPAPALAPDRRADQIVLTVPDSRRREDYVAAIGAMWQRARESFVAIGHALSRAKEKLPHGEYEQMVERELPFDWRTAYQLRVAAEAVISGRLPAERLPASYSTVYHLATLNHDHLQEAEQAGLIRPDLRRAEIVAFKKSVKRGANDRTAELKAALRRAMAQRLELDERIAEMEAELRAVGGVVIDGQAERV